MHRTGRALIIAIMTLDNPIDSNIVYNMRSGSYDPRNLQGGCVMLRTASAVSRPTARKHLISLLRNICASPGESASMKNARFAHGINGECNE